MRRLQLLAIVCAVPAMALVAGSACVGDTASGDAGADTGTMTDGGGGMDTGMMMPDGATCMGAMTSCNGNCVDLKTSDQNCGKCSHACQGGMCTNGVCQPLTICSGLNTPTTIKGVDNPPLVVVAAKGPLVRCQKAGGAMLTKLWTGTTTASLAGTDLGFNASGSVYFFGQPLFPDGGANGSALIYYVDFMASPASPTGGAKVFNPADLAVDGDNVLMHRTYQILGCIGGGCTLPTTIHDVGGGAGVTQAPGNPGEWLWADSTQVTGVIGHCNRASPVVACSNPPNLTTNAGDPHFLQVLGSTLYWADVPFSGKNRILSCALAGCNNNPTVIIGNENKIGGLVVDQTSAYWTDPISGQVRTCTLAGCMPTVLSGTETSPTGITADKDAIYWTNSVASGVVRKLAK